MRLSMLPRGQSQPLLPGTSYLEPGARQTVDDLALTQVKRPRQSIGRRSAITAARLPGNIHASLEREALSDCSFGARLESSQFIREVAVKKTLRPADRAEWLLATAFHGDRSIREHEFAAYTKLADRLPGDLHVLPHARLLRLKAEAQQRSPLHVPPTRSASLDDVVTMLATMSNAAESERAVSVTRIVERIAQLPRHQAAVLVHLASQLPQLPEAERALAVRSFIDASEHVPLTDREPLFRALIATVAHLDFRLRHQPLERLVKLLVRMPATSVVPLYHEMSRAIETVASQHRTRLRTSLAAVMKRLPASSGERNTLLLRHIRANHMHALPVFAPTAQTNGSQFIAMHERKLGNVVIDPESLGGGALVTITRAKMQHRVTVFDQQLNASGLLPWRQQDSAYIELAAALHYLPVQARTQRFNTMLSASRPLPSAARSSIMRALAYSVVHLSEPDRGPAARALLDHVDTAQAAYRAEPIFALIGALPLTAIADRMPLFKRLLTSAPLLPQPADLMCFAALANRVHILPQQDRLTALESVITTIGAKPEAERGLTMYVAAANLARESSSPEHVAALDLLARYEPGFAPADARAGRPQSQYEWLQEPADGSAGTLDAEWFEQLNRMGDMHGIASSDSDDDLTDASKHYEYVYSDSDGSLSQGSRSESSDDDLA